MKLYKSLLVGIAAVVGLSSCNDWLDVNDNPNSPQTDKAHYSQLIPWSQFYMNHIYGIVASNSSMYTGHWYRPYTTQMGYAATWRLGNASLSCRNATAQQWFYTMVANNYKPMYESSMNAGAYHYAGVAKFLRAWGYFMLVDNMGEVPYTDACTTNNAPTYDSGEFIYLDCLKELDEAIKLFEKTQESNTTPLSAADYWNGGDVQKWIKACYLFKARYMNHMSKKSAGKWSEGKYDEAEILACLDKAQMSNADNTIVRHQDTNTNSHDVLGWNEPVDYNPLFSCVGMNSNIYVTKTYTDLLTNFDGKGVEDPRANKFIPWARSEKSDSTDASIVWSEDGKWRRSLGVDIVNTNIINENGPYASSFGLQTAAKWNKLFDTASWQYKVPHWYCDDLSRQNDTVYIMSLINISEPTRRR